MTDNRTTPPTFVLAALAGGFLFMLGGALTAMETSSRTVMTVAAMCFLLIGAFAYAKVRQLSEGEQEIEDLRLEISTLETIDAGLRNRMTSTLRDPLMSIVGFTDRMLSEPAMDIDERTRLLTQIRNDAREVERVLADLAISDSAKAGAAAAEGVVILDEEVRSLIATAPPSLTVEADLQQSRAWADSAKVRQALRTILRALQDHGTTSLVVKTGQSSRVATVTLAAEGQLLPKDALEALTSVIETGRDTGKHVALIGCRATVASMGGRIGYAEAFGKAHIVVEFASAPEKLELRAPLVRPRAEKEQKAEQPRSEPDLSFSRTMELRPERPSASIRFS